MGYSGRYHAASLAAVFLALAIGILIGVGFGSDVVTGTAEDLESSLGSDLDQANEQIGELEEQLDQEAEFGRQAYPALVEARLRGREVALVAFGDLDDAAADDVRAALESADASLSEVAVVREPPDVDAAIAAIKADSRPATREADFEQAARRAGAQLVVGGNDFDDLRAALMTRYSGEPGDIDGVVILRARPEGMSDRDSQNTDTLETSFIEGMASTGPRLPIVGAERSDFENSSIDFFDANATASVDNIEQLPGRVSLVYGLGCAEGNFGVKETADALMPDLLVSTGLSCGIPDEANR
jgi:Copper transport outer membrane protein, MctB